MKHDPLANDAAGRALAILGALMTVGGILWLGRNFGWFAAIDWRHYWPVALIVAGVIELARFRRAS